MSRSVSNTLTAQSTTSSVRVRFLPTPPVVIMCNIGGAYTQGGYSESIVVDEKYVVNIPPGLDPAAAAPLLCAGELFVEETLANDADFCHYMGVHTGVTTYSPMKHHGLKAGQRLAVVGLGGLGHMGVKIAKAFGAFVAVISRGTKKREDALKLGTSSSFIIHKP